MLVAGVFMSCLDIHQCCNSFVGWCLVLDIRFRASPLVGFCTYTLVEALSMYQSFLVHDNVCAREDVQEMEFNHVCVLRGG